MRFMQKSQMLSADPVGSQEQEVVINDGRNLAKCLRVCSTFAGNMVLMLKVFGNQQSLKF